VSTPQTSEPLWTGEELLLSGYPEPCELVEGRIVPVSPTGAEHGRIEARIARRLSEFVESRNIGTVFTGEAGIYTHRDPDTVRGADVAFVSHDRLGGRTPRGFLRVPPELVVEILSPEDRAGELQRKLTEYFAIGVDRVWIVDPHGGRVLVHCSPTDFFSIGSGEIAKGEGVLSGFELPVDEIFRD
jgi:Uma2 family endonuclease